MYDAEGVEVGQSPDELVDELADDFGFEAVRRLFQNFE